MKTKFILHGGFTPGNQNENNSNFYKEILNGVSKKVKILIVPFAKDPERIPATTERVKGEFNAIKHDKELDFEVANEKSFLEQIKSVDVIYFQGGTTLKLLEALKKFPEMKDLLKGKIVSGESAGANVFGKYFYSPSANVASEGLGILPLKIIPHYKDEYKGVFKDVDQNLENLILKEYEYKVIERL